MSTPVGVPPELLDALRAARVELAFAFETTPAARTRQMIELVDAVTEKWEPKRCVGHETRTYDQCPRQAEPGGVLCTRHRVARENAQRRMAARRRARGA